MPRFELSPIKQIELAAAKIPGAISLAQGIPSFSLHPEIREYVEAQIRRGACDKYSLTSGLQELREEIALTLSSDGMLYDPDSEIIVTVGSIEAIAATLLAITTPGDEVIILSPTYTSYQGVIAMARCTPRFVPLDEDRNFDLDVDAIEAAITSRTKVIFYCNPNNPTGTVFSEESTRRLAALADERDLFIVTDEVYKDFYYVDLPHTTPARIPEVRARVIRVNSLSKAFAMTGWRCGFLHSDRSLVRQILPYHDALVTCAPVASQYAAIAALRAGDRISGYYKEEFRKRRDFVLSRLDRVSDLLDYQVPTASYFVFPRLKHTVPLAGSSVALAYDILEKAKVALVPGVAFGPSGESHLRISFGRDWPDLEAGCDRFEHYLRDVTGRKSTMKSGAKAPASKPEFFESFPQQMFAAVLKVCAKLYLSRNESKVIGITGSRGKTIFRRIIVERLAEKSISVRGGILSYNTAVGLPLSILQIISDPGWKGKVRVLGRALYRAIFAREESQYLVLEYGVKRLSDAHELLSIVKPDRLVLTDLGAAEPGDQMSELLPAVDALVSAVPPEAVIWSDTTSLSGDLRARLLPQNALKLRKTGEFPSDSYELAVEASKLLEQCLRPVEPAARSAQSGEDLPDLKAEELKAL